MFLYTCLVYSNEDILFKVEIRDATQDSSRSGDRGHEGDWIRHREGATEEDPLPHLLHDFQRPDQWGGPRLPESPPRHGARGRSEGEG